MLCAKYFSMTKDEFLYNYDPDGIFALLSLHANMGRKEENDETEEINGTKFL